MAYNSFINKQVGIQSPTFRFQKDRNNGAVLAGDGLGEFQFYGFDGSGYLLTSAITSTASGTIAANRIGSNLEFYTHPDSVTVSTQRMVLESTGQLQINDPSSNVATLFVTNNQSTPNITLRTANATATNAPHIHFTRSHAGTTDIVANDELGRLEYLGFQGGAAREAAEIASVAQTVNGTNAVSGYLSFRTVPTTYAAMAERVRIAADGFVTINIPAAAGSALTVNGVNSAANYSLISQASVAGGIHNAARLWNYDGTAGSATQVSIDVFNQLAATGGDPSLRFLNIGIRAVTLGIDSSTDQFVIANSSALGTSNILTWTASNNQINLPLQASFHAYIGTAQNNVTGDNTAYDVIFQTERYDVSSSYNNTTGIFTAPATGKYIFNSQLIIEGLTAGMTGGLYGFLVNGFSYFGGVTYCNPYACAYAGSFFSIQNTAIFALTAGDTVQCRVQVNGGAKVCDFTAQTASYFAGQLLS